MFDEVPGKRESRATMKCKRRVDAGSANLTRVARSLRPSLTICNAYRFLHKSRRQTLDPGSIQYGKVLAR
jgi:hypothetical protein